MKTAAVYIRVSTDEQSEHSPESQLAEIKRYAKAHDMLINAEHIYKDVGISGRTAKKRPAFQNMIAAAKSKPAPFDVILVWKFSRFARNQEESILYKSLLKKENNIDVVSISEDVGNDMFGSLIERIIEWMDEFYSIRLSEEVRTKMKMVAEQGKVQTAAPFGYSKKAGGPMIIVPEQAEWIRKIFQDFLAGKSIVRIARELNTSGILTKRGNKFENRTIEYILYNPMYAGYTRWTPTGKTLSKRNFHSEDTITVKGDFEPIISEDLFKQVQEKLSSAKKLRKKYAKPAESKKHWLSGLVYCSNCSSALTYSSANNGFQCYKYAHGQCNESHYISAKKIEQAVIDGISQVTIDNEFIKDNAKPVLQENYRDYSNDIERLEKMLQRAKNTYLAGIDTIEEYGENKERINKEIEVFKDLQLKEEMKKSHEVESQEVITERFSSIVSLLKSDVANDIKHNAIAGIVENITFNRDQESIKIFFNL